MARKLEMPQWQSFLDRLSKALTGKRAMIEISSLEIGDQVEAQWLPLIGITYDRKDDIIEVALEGHDHLIHKPRELYYEEGVAGLQSLAVIDAEGTRQIVQLKDPLMLPSASAPSP